MEIRLGASFILSMRTENFAYRFYYTDDTVLDYSFSVTGGRALSFTEGTDTNGKYLEVRVYAYEILSGVSFTDGENTYEYNVYSYYAWAKTNGAAAATLVERLVKYCESAESYRISVQG